MRIRRFLVETRASCRHDRAMRYFVPLALTLVALAGCAAPPPAPAVRPAPIAAPPSRPAPAPAPLASDWNDWPFTTGDWRYAKSSASSYASFDGDGRSRLGLACNRLAHQIELTGIAFGAPVTIRTTSTTRTVAPRSSGGDPPISIITLSANDPLLDAIAFSRGRFVVEQPGAPPLVLPPYAEIGRVIEDCRG